MERLTFRLSFLFTRMIWDTVDITFLSILTSKHNLKGAIHCLHQCTMASHLECWLIQAANHPNTHQKSQVNQTRCAIKKSPYRTMGGCPWKPQRESAQPWHSLNSLTKNVLHLQLGNKAPCERFFYGTLKTLLCYVFQLSISHFQSIKLSTRLRNSSCFTLWI